MTDYDTPPPRGPQRLTYAHKRFYNMPDLEPRADDEVYEPASLRLLPMAARTLTGFLETAGKFLAGPLFGTRDTNTLTVSHAAIGRPTNLASPLTSPIDVDVSYVRGFADAVSQHGTMLVDWIGHWVAVRNSWPDMAAHHTHWVLHAYRAGLMDGARPLVIVTREAGLVTYRAFVCDDGHDITSLPLS